MDATERKTLHDSQFGMEDEQTERDEWGIEPSELTIKCRCNECGKVWDEQVYADDMFYYKKNDDGTFFCGPKDGLCYLCFTKQ